MDFEHLQLEQQHPPGSAWHPSPIRYAEKPSSFSSREASSTKSVNIDLSAIEDPMIREAINPSSSLSMHEMVKQSDVQLTNLANASPTSSERPSAMRTLTPLPLSHVSLNHIDKNGEILLEPTSGCLNPGNIIVGIVARPEGSFILLLNVLVGKEKHKWWIGDLGYSDRPRSEYRRLTGCRRRSETLLNAHIV
jgi:hypothetical protein